MNEFTVDPEVEKAPTTDSGPPPSALPEPRHVVPESSGQGKHDGSVFFVGTATTIIEWAGMRLMTDPNFLHDGDHVHLGPGVNSKRRTNPAIDLHDLPRIDLVLLSHYHEDHFDRMVEKDLRRDLPIITTPHAKECLVEKKKNGEKFTGVTALDVWESSIVKIGNQKEGGQPAVKVTGMPGKHVPPGAMSIVNEYLGAVPPTNGWMLELGRLKSSDKESFENGYRVYISGDTLMVDELKEIPERYKNKEIDLMLVHLGGTTIPSPSLPLLMVTMDAKQGIQLVQLVQPKVTIPIHFDDYEAFVSPLSDFKKAVGDAGLTDKVVYLDRKDRYDFNVHGQKK